MIEPVLAEKLKKIRLVAMDVDGTFTDGRLFFDAGGHVMKSFHAHDGFGIELLKLCGILRGFLTGRTDPSARFRAQNLGADFMLEHVLDKQAALASLQDKYGFTTEECLYIGDDIADIDAFASAGVRVAVADAADALKSRADLVTANNGGCGAVREVVDMILEVQGLDPVALWIEKKHL